MGLERDDLLALSCPDAGHGDLGRARVIEAVLPKAVQTSVAVFLGEQGSALGGDNASLSGGLERIVSAPLNGEHALRLPVAQLIHALHAPDGDPVWAAAALLAERTVQGGVNAEWRVELPRSRSLRFGPLLSPPGRTFEVHSSATSQTRVRTRDEAGQWTETSLAAPDEAWQRLPRARLQEAWAVVAPRPPSDALRLQPDHPVSDVATSEVVSVTERAVSQIAQLAPDYLPWIDRVIRCIVPIQAPEETSLSSSTKGQHGIICASFPASVVHTSEVLVHEAAHQYFNILEHAAFVVSLPMDGRTYFSPYVKRQRSIDRILFAYHAFANVLLFHRRCLAAGADPQAYVGNGLADQEKLLAVVQTYLRESAALSSVGRAIFEPLDARVGELLRS